MSKKPYKRKPGDFEVRILSDGRVVMVAPDEELMEIARVVDPNSNVSQPTMVRQAHHPEQRRRTETKDDVTRENTEAKQDNCK